MQTREPIPYVGRFAPSPTGPLHFGSLAAAAASYLQARANNGIWLLRIEDIDPPREQAGASASIIEALERYGFEWDADCLFQSTRIDAYDSALATLLEMGMAYRCNCSRRDLADAPRGPLGPIYPGTCRDGCPPGDAAIRLRTEDSDVAFDDRLQGRISQNLEEESGDFVVRRRDDLIAYHLAVVVDDEFQGITQVVRGADLLDSTSRQICLQRALGYRTPDYMHLPVALSADGRKLGKRVQTDPVKHQNPAYAVKQALEFLGQKPPSGYGLEDLWDWALEHWNNGFIPRRKGILPAGV
jgi:glutamyl-Q tRNA(Asp) synthetase